MTATPQHQEFIALYPNAVSPDVCKQICDHFDDRTDDHRAGRVGGGVRPELKHSTDITLSNKPHWHEVEVALNRAMFGCLLHYLRHYPYTLLAPLMLQAPDEHAEGGLRRLDAKSFTEMSDQDLSPIVQHMLRPGAINLQRYRANEGGYPYWHCEQYPKDASCETLHRTLLWSVYLNDDFDAGETEFFHQNLKVTPATGTLLMAPAGFTHTHRGNMPKNGDKYFATSWVLFRRSEEIFGHSNNP